MRFSFLLQTDSESAIQLKVGKDSLQLNIKQDQFMEYIRKYKAKKMFKSSRSRSVNADMSSQREEKAPLLMTLSEIHFSDDFLLDVISEDSLEYAGDVSSDNATFQLGSSPIRSSLGDYINEEDGDSSVAQTLVVNGATGTAESKV